MNSRTLGTLALVLVFAATLGALGLALDSTERPSTRTHALLTNQTPEEAELSRDLRAAILCRQRHGEAGFTWTATGQLVCIPRRGKQILASNF